MKACRIKYISIVRSTPCWGLQQTKHQIPHHYVWGIHWWLVDCPHKGQLCTVMQEALHAIRETVMCLCTSSDQRTKQWLLVYERAFVFFKLSQSSGGLMMHDSSHLAHVPGTYSSDYRTAFFLWIVLLSDNIDVLKLHIDNNSRHNLSEIGNTYQIPGSNNLYFQLPWTVIHRLISAHVHGLANTHLVSGCRETTSHGSSTYLHLLTFTLTQSHTLSYSLFHTHTISFSIYTYIRTMN